MRFGTQINHHSQHFQVSNMFFYCRRRAEMTFWQGCRLSSPYFSVHSTFLKLKSLNILSLSSPVIGVLAWLIHDGLKTNYPGWSMWVSMLVAEIARSLRLHKPEHSSGNLLALL